MIKKILLGLLGLIIIGGGALFIMNGKDWNGLRTVFQIWTKTKSNRKKILPYKSKYINFIKKKIL